MKKTIITGIFMILVTDNAMAYGYVYDSVDAMADQEQAMISAREQAAVMRELREGDFREAQMIMQRDEEIKREIRQDEARYDRYRDSGYGYGNYYNGGW
jgi:hypothetical protein